MRTQRDEMRAMFFKRQRTTRLVAPGVLSSINVIAMSCLRDALYCCVVDCGDTDIVLAIPTGGAFRYMKEKIHFITAVPGPMKILTADVLHCHLMYIMADSNMNYAQISFSLYCSSLIGTRSG